MRELFLTTTKDTRYSLNQTDEGLPKTQLPPPIIRQKQGVAPAPLLSLTEHEEKEARAIGMMYVSQLEKGYQLLKLRADSNPLHTDIMLNAPLFEYGERLKDIKELLMGKKQTNREEAVRFMRKLLDN